MKIYIEDTDGQKVQVYPAAVAASRLGYTPRYTRHLADTGQLPGWKIAGQWFVSLRERRVTT